MSDERHPGNTPNTWMRRPSDIPDSPGYIKRPTGRSGVSGLAVNQARRDACNEGPDWKQSQRKGSR